MSSMMNLEQIRLKQNPILSRLLLGPGQGTLIGEKLFPRLPQVLSGVTIANIGNQALQRYNLRRAPGTATKRINIKYDGKVYTVNQYSVEIPIPRELIRESQAMATMGIPENIKASTLAMTTARSILDLDYELECATVATATATYYPGNTLALAGGTKWSAPTGTPVTDILAASDIIRKRTGKRANLITFSADAWFAFKNNAQVKSYLPNTQTGPCTKEQAATILDIPDIECGDAIYFDDADQPWDAWGNSAILSYVPKITGDAMSMAEPAFGFTNVIEGHPFAEQPYYSYDYKSWIYGATFERQVNIGNNGAAFLFLNPK